MSMAVNHEGFNKHFTIIEYNKVQQHHNNNTLSSYTSRVLLHAIPPKKQGTSNLANIKLFLPPHAISPVTWKNSSM
jgi:hypothetical protein